MAGSPGVSPEAHARAIAGFKRLPLGFEWNQGQAEPAVKAFARGPGFAMMLTRSESVVVLSKRGGPDAVVRWKPLRANPNPSISALEPLPSSAHYFIGNDPSKWIKGATSFRKIKYAGVYPGIDLLYYGNREQLEYDFVVAPGADPRNILISIGGADRVRLDSAGDLVVETGAGELRHRKPFSYQEVDGQRREVSSRFVLEGRNRIRFAVGEHDPSLPLVIDPSLSFSTYLGGSGEDRAVCVAIDAVGNTYVAGSTTSLNFPLTPNAPFPNYNGGATDAFLTVLLLGGAENAFVSSYLGGNGADEIDSVTVALFPPTVYIVGTTTSTNFPLVGAIQNQNAGGADAFVMKVEFPTSIVYSTYFGGSGDDQARGIVLDTGGNIQFAGYTNSTDLPTQSPIQGSNAGGYDAFLAKLTNVGAPLLFSSYIGGAFDDLAYGLAADPRANSYLAGTTNSSNFGQPGVPGFLVAHQAFLTSINTTGSVRRYQRIIGGNGTTLAKGVAVDASFNAYLIGHTSSPAFPVTPNALQGSLSGPFDVFFTKFNGPGNIVYSTYFGGSGADLASGIALDASGNITFAGATNSTNLTTLNPVQANNAGGVDGFVTRIRADLTGLVYSTYLGGSGTDSVLGIEVGAQGNAVAVGSTTSTNFPTTPEVIAPDHAGGTDAFAARILTN